MLYLDFETYNAEKDIKCGTYEYARTCEILLCAWAIDDGRVQLWDLTVEREMPGRLRDELFHNHDQVITAHNAIFDRTVLDEGFLVESDIKRWRCTQAKARAHGFPGKLSTLCRILGLPQDKAKLKDGQKLINRFSKPAPKNHKADRYDRHSHPEEWARFCGYAMRDVEAMREIDKRLPDWNYNSTILSEYHLDQTINARGFAVDFDLVEAGAKAAVTEKEQLFARFREIIGEQDFDRPTQREKFKAYMNATYDLDLTDTRAETFEEYMGSPNFPDVAKELMQISIQSNKTSTAKYASLAPAVSPDDRFRGGLMVYGAARTRRWSGQVFQPQNLPSRNLPDQWMIDGYISALKVQAHEFLFDDLMLLGSASIRGAVIAPAEHKLVVADLSNIEGRVNAWLAGETWKLNAFAAYDEGEGPDLYKVAAGGILGQQPEEVSKTNRNAIGKVSELALGYQGGVGAIQKFASGEMAQHWGTIRANVTPSTSDKAFYNVEQDWAKDWLKEIGRNEWVASETVKLAWREKNSNIVKLWENCEKAAISAVKNPGYTFRVVPHLRFKCVKRAGFRYLLIKLPSNRFLTYFAPRVVDGKLSYMGVNSTTKQWQRIGSYGGKIVENLCQSLSRDILAHNMRAVEDAGYNIVLTVHDELVTETPDNDNYSAEKLSKIMATNPPWLPNFPLAAEGFEANRYRKG